MNTPFRNQMLRSAGCVLDRRLNRYRADDAVICTLGEITGVRCERHVPASRPGQTTARGTYQVYFHLYSGKKVYTYLGEHDESESQRQTQILSEFLAAVPERAVSRAVGL